MSNANDFVIENGVLKEYKGNGGDVTIPDGVQRIDDGVFRWENLTSVSIPNSVISIGDSAFFGNRNLKGITIPNSVTSIEDNAFCYCENLTSVTIPAGVISIGSCVFSFCKKLKHISFLGCPTSIGHDIFNECNIDDFDISSEAANRPENFRIDNGTLKKYEGVGGDVIVPDGVTSIGDSAFSGCSCLLSVSMPDSVITIGSYAFFCCSNLKSVKLSDNLTSIGSSAFQYCAKLREVVIPDSVTRVCDEAFSDCGSVRISVSDEAANRPENFEIENGKLKKYKGPGGNVKIPQDVTEIAGAEGLYYGSSAFSECSTLTGVIIPEGVVSIGNCAFSKCSNLMSVAIPESMTSIGRSAFSNCKELKSVSIPGNVSTLLKGTFNDCTKLETVILPDALIQLENDSYQPVFGNCTKLQSIEFGESSAQLIANVFGNRFPSGLVPQLSELYPHMADGALKQYVLDKKVWQELDPALQAEIFIKRQSKSLTPAYAKCVRAEELESLGKAIQKNLEAAKPSSKDCSAAAAYMTLFYDKSPVGILKSLYDRLKQVKSGAKAVRTIEEHVALMEKLGGAVTVDESLSPVAQKIMETLIADKKNEKDLAKSFKDYYGLTAKDLPATKYADKSAVEPMVALWLFTVHEKRQEYNWGQPDTVAGYNKPGICHDAEEIVAFLDQSSLQSALLKLADENLGLSGRSKKMFLAYPICRYADEELMVELTKRAPKWRSSVSGNDAPPLATFRKAAMYSNSRAAMLFAEKYHDLDAYAKIRGTDADTIRDCYLSDVGLDEQGGKVYDLGNQIVTARLQKDLSFLIELANGKTAKSLPKKGADSDKYDVANKDFSEMKKSVKKILKNRFAVLFEEFLSGKKRKSDDWQSAYLHNPLLREAASLVVWAQGKKTFTLTANGAIDSAEQPYTFTDKPIVVAHPMEMKADDLTAWQKYFTKCGLKQPFAQVWESVHKPADIAKDRYAGCMIPYYRFLNQEKHGITVRDYDFHNEIEISIRGCQAYIDRIDWHRHEINVEDRFEVKEFEFKKFTRQVNHIVAYLDRVTVWDRVRKDDTTVMDQMGRFTLAQITEFISAAQEANAVNVLAALMDYKNSNFVDFDPMDEFTLEW